MTVLYGTLEWFHEQGMEGNALPMFIDGSSRSVNRFGKVAGSYDGLTQLQSGMHLTIYSSNWVHDRDVEKMENENWQYPYYFSKELDLQHTMTDNLMGFPIRIIHDADFDSDTQHVWLMRRAILYKPGGEVEIDWVDDRPAQGNTSIKYQETNGIVSFFESEEEYEQFITDTRKAFSDVFGSADDVAERPKHHQTTYRPAWQTWQWMFRQGLCARLET